MTDDLDTAREALVDMSREAIARELSNATAGNMSLRTETGMLITPSGVPPRDMSPDQIVEMTLDGAIRGAWKPSSEWALHAAIYRRRPEAGAVVHCHPMHGTALAALRRAIPAFHYMVAGLGGTEVPCAPYRTFGTPELAEVVAQTLGTRYHGCLMANHGTISLGATLRQAFERTDLLEVMSRQYLLALSSGQQITLLSAAEMEDVRQISERLGYGSPRRTAQPAG